MKVELLEIAVRWKSLGEHFGMTPGKLNLIKYNTKDDAEECLREVVLWWLRGNGVAAMWKNLIDILHKIEEVDLAKDIRKKKAKREL